MGVTKEQFQAALARCCCGQSSAMQWLALWREFVNAVDDIEDEPFLKAGERPEAIGDRATTPEFRMRAWVLALELYTHPFFRANEARLKQVVLNCTNAYADVLKWEQSEVQWQKEFVDVYRHFGAEMVIAVAQICGGWDHARSLSEDQRTVNYLEHHDADGKPH